MTNNNDLLEELAALEHEQWMSWAKTLMNEEELSDSKKTQWLSYCVPYNELPEEVKELDRKYARKVFAILLKFKSQGLL